MTQDTTRSLDQRSADQRTLVPRVDVLEDETGITVLADLPA